MIFLVDGQQVLGGLDVLNYQFFNNDKLEIHFNQYSDGSICNCLFSNCEIHIYFKESMLEEKMKKVFRKNVIIDSEIHIRGAPDWRCKKAGEIILGNNLCMHSQILVKNAVLCSKL
jgi:hypothetical protein